MRIFQVLSGSSNSAVKGNATWHRNLYEPLVDLGHDVVYFSADEGLRARQKNDGRLRSAFSQKLLDAFRKAHRRKPFDLFFAYLTDGMVDSAVISEIGSCGVVTANFSCNNVHQFDVIRTISPRFDYNLHAERDVGEKFRAIGAKPKWWPMASNPNYFKPFTDARTIPVSFAGANYSLRARYIRKLLDSGIDVHAYGPTWKFGARSPSRAVFKRYLLIARNLCALSIEAQSSYSSFLAEHDFNRSLYARYPHNIHGQISDHELIRLYSRSMISLGFLEVHEENDPSLNVTRHIHLREFEAPMCGALYCTGYLDELTEFFDPDREIVLYRSEIELLDKIRFYLANPVSAENIRAAARRRALAEHTYHRRFETLFAAMQLPP